MNLLSLNVWGARAGLNELLGFFKEHQDVDIFCLQEVWNGGEHTRHEVAAGQKMGKVEMRLLTKIGEVSDHNAMYLEVE